MLFLCVLSIFPAEGSRHRGFPLPFQLQLLSPDFSVPTLDVAAFQHRPAGENPHWASSSPFSGPRAEAHPGRTLSPDTCSARTHAHPGQTLTPDRCSPQTDPHPRHSLTSERPSPQLQQKQAPR